MLIAKFRMPKKPPPQKERKYEDKEEMYLLNADHVTYLAGQNWEGYCTADQEHPVPVYLENRAPGQEIRYRQSEVYIRSRDYPGR